MDWQSAASLGIVAVTAILMVRSAFKRGTHKGSACEVCMRAQMTKARQIQHRQVTP